MLLARTLFVVFILSLSFIGPYKAFLSSYPEINKEFIEIESGSSMLSTLDILNSGSLINNFYFKVFLKVNSISSFQAGEYKITGLTLQELFARFVTGETYTHTITLIEGMNRYEIIELIKNSSLNNDCENLSCIDTNYPFKEGIFYPDTYFFKKGFNASSILNNSHKKLNKVLTDIWISESNKGLLDNKYQALILASIIEKEAGNNSEKTAISGVFLKRITLGMKLQADPTIIYGLLPNFDGDIKKTDILDKNNLYNTYMIKGLPPTPISISSLSSIEAAITSEPGEYLFFVADSPTSHYFSKTYDEHLNMIKKVGLDKWK